MTAGSGPTDGPPPADGWLPELEELGRRTELAQQMGGEERVGRHRAAGRLPVRERIAKLLDAGSFHEIGALAGKARYEGDELREFTPSNFVAGRGRIDGRPVVVGADDFTVRGGAADGAVGHKASYAERMAHELRLPMVRLVDGTGGGGSVRTLDTLGFSYVPANPAWDLIVDLLSEVPVVGAALGPVAGLGAARVVATHFSVMVRGTSQVFVAGPPVVERGMGRRVEKEELGGSAIHAHGNGVIDNEAASEEEALAQLRRFLSYLPANVWELPPRAAAHDDPARREEELVRIVPRDRRRGYDVRRVLELVLDRGSVFELGRFQGASLVTALARLDGRAVGVMANDPRVYGGGLTAGASEKMTRFVDLCDTFHLPVVYFVDQPGFVIGVEAERAGTIRYGVRALYAVQQAVVPWVSILMRRVYGVAGAGHGKPQGLNLRYAWPSGDWGSLPIEGGVQAAYRRDIEAAADPERRRAELEAHFERYRSPFRTAEAFGVEEIVDPRDTRRLLVEWVDLAYRLLPSQLGRIARGHRP